MILLEFISFTANFILFLQNTIRSQPLLKTHHLYDELKMNIVIPVSNSNGDLYIEYSSESKTYRYLYAINSETGEQINLSDNKTMKITTNEKVSLHELIFITYNNLENYLFSLGIENTYLFDILTGTVTSKTTAELTSKNSGTKPSFRNNIIKLKNGDYLFTIIRNVKIGILYHKSFFITFNFNSASMDGYTELNHVDKIIGYNNMTSCFETENSFIECFYLMALPVNSFAIGIYDNSLSTVKDNIQLGKINNNTFTKIFHIKKEIGGYVFFDTAYNNGYPIIHIKNYDNSLKSLNNVFSFDCIVLNGDGKYNLISDINLSDAIKINDNKFSVILTAEDLIHLLICIFDLYDDDTSLRLSYYYLDMSEMKPQNIRSFKFRDYLGISFYDSINNYPGYIIFGYPNDTNISEYIFEKKILDKDSLEYINLKNYIKLNNMIYGFQITGIKILNFTDSSITGIELISNTTNEKISLNQELNINEVIIFKLSEVIKTISGKYILEFIPIIKNLDFDEFETMADKIVYYGSGTKENFKNYYTKNIFYGPKYSFNYIFENQEIIFDEEEIEEEENFEIKDNIEGNEKEKKGEKKENIENEEKKNEFWNEEKKEIEENKEFEEYEERRKKEENENIIEKENEIENNEKIEEKEIEIIEEEKQTEKEINNNSNIKIPEIISNKCKELFYFQNNEEICISSKICPEDYPFINKLLKYCNNCPFTYKNKCYEKCPQNTCVDSVNDKYLSTCIDIPNSNTTVIKNQCINDIKSIVEKKIKQEDILLITENITDQISIYSYSTKSEIESLMEINNKLTYVNLKECKTKLLENNSLPNNSDLYILCLETPNKLSNSSVNDFSYQVFNNKGEILDISICNNISVEISSPIIDKDLINFKYASALAEQNIDIYDINSEFYYDNCLGAYINKSDITITDRQKTIYPNNISLCVSDCKYIGVNINNSRIICECNSQFSTQNYQLSYDEEGKFFEEVEHNFFIYLIDLINYQVFTCHKLIFQKKSYINNAGFYVGISLLFLITVMISIFIKNGNKHIRIAYFKNEPDDLEIKNQERNFALKDKKVIPKKIIHRKKTYNKKTKIKFEEIKKSSNPPKKKNISILNIIKIDKKNNNNISNLNNENKIFKLDKRKSKTKNSEIKKISRDNSKHIFTKKKQRNVANSKLDINVIRNDNDSSIKQEGESINSSSNRINLKDKKKRIFLKTNKKKHIINSKNMKLECRNNIQFRPINDKERNNKITNNENDENKEQINYNDLSFFEAIKKDKRNFFNIYLSYFCYKVDIIRIIFFHEEFSHMALSLSCYLFDLLLDLAFNALLFSDTLISQKYFNDGNLLFISSLTVSLISNILSNLIIYFCEKLINYHEILEAITKEVKDKTIYYRLYLKHSKIFNAKFIIYYIYIYILGILSTIYLLIFCAIYRKTQPDLFFNYVTGVAESIGFTLGICLLIALLRYISLSQNIKRIYIISKFIDEKF